MAEIVCDKITSRLVYAFLASFVFVSCVAPATSYTRNRSYQAVLPACGSRQFDTLRFMCQLKMWEAKNCVVAKRALCKGNTYSIHPICRFECTDSTSNSQSSSNKTSIDRREREISLEDVQSLFQNLFGSNNRKVRSTLPNGAGKRRQRRLIARRCCRRSCSRHVLSEFCNAT